MFLFSKYYFVNIMYILYIFQNIYVQQRAHPKVRPVYLHNYWIVMSLQESEGTKDT